MTAPLGSLLSDSWSSFRHALVPIIVGAVIFGLIQGVSQSFIGERVVEKTGSALEGLGFSQEEMQALQQRIQAGDQAAVQEFQQKMEALGGAQGEKVLGVVAATYGALIPIMGGSILIMWIVSLIASAYFLLIALHDKLTFQEALARTPGLLIPLFLLSLWVFIRSLLWIPIVNFFTVFLLAPRFVCAPVLLAKDHKGVLESASISYRQTQGLNGKVLGNLISAGLLAMIVVMVINMILGIFGRGGMLLAPIVGMFATAFLTIFTVKLAITIEQNPARR